MKSWPLIIIGVLSGALIFTVGWTKGVYDRPPQTVCASPFTILPNAQLYRGDQR